jgi:hypothetical protein
LIGKWLIITTDDSIVHEDFFWEFTRYQMISKTNMQSIKIEGNKILNTNGDVLYTWAINDGVLSLHDENNDNGIITLINEANKDDSELLIRLAETERQRFYTETYIKQLVYGEALDTEGLVRTRTANLWEVSSPQEYNFLEITWDRITIETNDDGTISLIKFHKNLPGELFPDSRNFEESDRIYRTSMAQLSNWNMAHYWHERRTVHNQHWRQEAFNMEITVDANSPGRKSFGNYYVLASHPRPNYPDKIIIIFQATLDVIRM